MNSTVLFSHYMTPADHHNFKADRNVFLFGRDVVIIYLKDIKHSSPLDLKIYYVEVFFKNKADRNVITLNHPL